MASLLNKLLFLGFLVGLCAAQCEERLDFPDWMLVNGYLVFCDEADEADDCVIEGQVHLQCNNIRVGADFESETFPVNVDTAMTAFCEKLISLALPGFEYSGIFWTSAAEQTDVLHYTAPTNLTDSPTEEAWNDVETDYLVDLACTVRPPALLP